MPYLLSAHITVIGFYSFVRVIACLFISRVFDTVRVAQLHDTLLYCTGCVSQIDHIAMSYPLAGFCSKPWSLQDDVRKIGQCVSFDAVFATAQ